LNVRDILYIIFLSSLLIACGGSSSQKSPDTNGTPTNGTIGNDTGGDSKQPALVDIVTYNIEWLGNPQSAKFNGTAQQQIQAAAEDILSGNGEIYALQEIGGQAALSQLIDQLNTLDGINDWSGDTSQDNSKQSLAFVYKTNIVTNVNFETLSFSQSNNQSSSQAFAGRYPYMMTADVVINDTNLTLRLINLHLKCCAGNSNAERRASAMGILLPYLQQQYANDNIIVLGDLNVAEDGGSNGEILDWGMYQDSDNDQRADFSYAAGSLLDKAYNPAIKDSDIDHILISDELKSAWLAVTERLRNRYLTTQVSDHSPVATTLDLSR
jgi:endonuclease/exonuclease/phosphatase family metal-dependent hydrolase